MDWCVYRVESLKKEEEEQARRALEAEQQAKDNMKDGRRTKGRV